MYEYLTPPGWGDTFFQYVFDAQGKGLVDGQSYKQLGVGVNDGQFLMRFWSGLTTIAETLQIYDWMGRKFASEPMALGNGSSAGWGQMVVLPEVVYPDNGGNIRFDLGGVMQNQAGTDGDLTILDSQIVFSGVRRRRGVVGDPVPSAYKYYEKQYSIPFTLTIENYASSGGVFLPPSRFQIPIQDFDFELRRIELALTEQGEVPFYPFKMTLYDTNKVQTSNLPVLSNLLCNVGTIANAIPSSGEMNFWPSPPMLYRRNSVIQLDIYSLLVSPATLPATFQMLFTGVRRIPC